MTSEGHSAAETRSHAEAFPGFALLRFKDGLSFRALQESRCFGVCLAFTLPLAFLPPSPPPCLLEPTVACVRSDAVTQDTVHSERPPLAPTCPVLRDVPPAPGRCFALSPRGGFPQASGRGPNGCRLSFVLVTADALPGATGRSC